MGKNLSTNLIHTGDGQVCKKLAKTASVPETFPIYLTSVYAFDDVPSLDAIYDHKADGYIYGRSASPNADAASSILAAADQGEGALLFASGMASITAAILSSVKTGDHLIASDVLYGGVRDFMENELSRFGVDVTFINLLTEDPTPHIRDSTKLIYAETISNPLMEVPDIEALSRTAHAHNLLFFVDNTFATPIIARPLELGADAALYSVTKYLGGHSDITGGAVVASRGELIEKIRRLQTLYGAVASPSDCWLLARSMRTLSLRVKRHAENAAAVARFLESHPKVEKVFYPGLESSPSYERARRQFKDGLCGGMLSINLRGSEGEASAMIEEMKMIHFVPSLAGTATTVSYASKTSHRFYGASERERLGITMSQLRFSIGLEEPEDIIQDISAALDKI
jgi:methionine-gamma-lyase